MTMTVDQIFAVSDLYLNYIGAVKLLSRLYDQLSDEGDKLAVEAAVGDAVRLFPDRFKKDLSDTGILYFGMKETK